MRKCVKKNDKKNRGGSVNGIYEKFNQGYCHSEQRQCHKDLDDKEVRYSEYTLTTSEVVTIIFYKGG